jgi:L-threonylcarbamoyladenylate synthase
MDSKKNSPESDSGAPVLRVDPAAPDAPSVTRIVKALSNGGVVVMRTDTVYGLVASVRRLDALEKLVALKERPADKGFILLVADWIGVRSVTSHLSPVARHLGTRYWPGPLTLVLPAQEGLPPSIVSGQRTVAVRVPDDPLLQAVLRLSKGALAAPSANRAGEEPPATAAAAAAAFGKKVELVVDGGPAAADRPSTIVHAVGRSGETLRQGAIDIPAEDLSPL